MRILVTGGGGMIGQKFARSLAASQWPIRELILHDLEEPGEIANAGFPVTRIFGNIASQSEARRLASLNTEVIIHLAAIVSGEAEAVFEKGWSVNARGTFNLLEAVRNHGQATDRERRPKFIFASSIAVFGPPYPVVIDDEFLSAPLTSYGAQKAVTEMFVSEYSRKGFIDGISIRFPTICVRPGLANKAASSFFSAIIREPLNGETAILPVPREICHWFASPRSAVGFIMHALRLDFDRLEGRRALNMPGVSCSIAEMIAALENKAGHDVVRLIRERADEKILAIVRGWPHAFQPDRAHELGFVAEASFDDIIQNYLDEDYRK